MKNTLLNIIDLPNFTSINIEDIENTITSIIESNKIKIDQLLKDKLEIDSLILEFEKLDNNLSIAWSPISHLNSVRNSDELRIAHDNCLEKLSDYSTEQAQNTELYNVYKNIKEDDSFNKLNFETKKIIDNSLQKFKLNGVSLSADKKKIFKELKTKLSNLHSKFEQNVMDATQAFQIHIEDKQQLQGLPNYVKDMAAQSAKDEDLKGWLFTLDAPSYISVMTFSSIRKFREEIYIAFATRASDEGPNKNEFDNTNIMNEILQARKEIANILNYNNYAELSIANKMANKTEDVLNFLNDLNDKSKKQAEEEFNDLKKYAKKEFNINNIQAWDIMYVSEKLKQKEYGISQEELKPYFPMPKVLNGLFEIVNRLYGVKIEEISSVDVWHEDVKFYQITDENGEIRGQFYLDLYARNKKRGGAWMDECIGRMKIKNKIQIPVAYLTCNLTASIGDSPALLNHNEVVTIFHEFGHGLQHMLTKIDSLFISGISGVEWDAVELPSQFMENWCWEKEGLELISGHVESGDCLPDNLYKKLIKAKNFQSAMIMVRQLEFALFDFRLHMEIGTENFESVQALLDEVREQVAVIIPPALNKFQNAFTHIFAGGYAAGYYSYKWAEVLSADAFSKFEEKGIFDRQTGNQFLTNILETGGSENAIDLFKRFRGREPNIDALLRHSGL